MTERESSVVRARFDFAYDGTDFAGWAVQPGLRTVQGEFEAALARVTRVEEVRVTVAGRTDAGVHARAQVAHADIPEREWRRLPGHGNRTPEQGLLRRLNGVLPKDVRVHAVTTAPAGFEARFSAMERRYVYRINDGATLVDPLTRRFILTHDRPLDVDALNEASDTLMGLRDFAPFCRGRERATTIRTLTELSWARTAEGIVEATVRADAFCHSMVRGLVGALLPVGEGRRDLEWLASVASTPTRSDAVAVAPARGLTLEQVVYPDDGDVASRAALTRVRRTLD